MRNALHKSSILMKTVKMGKNIQKVMLRLRIYTHEEVLETLYHIQQAQEEEEKIDKRFFV